MGNIKASGLLSKTFPEIVGTSGGTFEQTDLSVPTEPEWFSRGVERDADLPFSDFDSGRGTEPLDSQPWEGMPLSIDVPQSEPSWLERSLERDTELPVGQPLESIPLSIDVLQSEPSWLEQSLERDTELPVGQPLESIPLSVNAPWSEPSWLEQPMERDTEIPVGKPIEEKLFCKLVAKKSPTPDISKGLGKRQEKRDISQLEQFVVNSLPLMMYEGELCLYKPPYWRKLNRMEAETEIRAFLEQEYLADCLTESEYRKIYNLLVINSDIKEEGRLTSPSGKINMLDGTYDLQTRELLPHNAEDHFFSCINVRGQEMSTCDGDTFETFVQNCSDGDPVIRRQLLQLVALTILGRPYKHFFVLLGESNTGKTQFGRFLEELVGRANIETVRGVHDFADRWTVGSLEGKLLGTCLDLPDGPLPATAVGIIKQVVGDDPVKGERKYHESSTFYEKPLLLFAGNHPIQIPHMEKEQALLNRMIVIPFRNPVPESSMRQELYKDLLEEAPYIVKEALIEYYELEQNNFQLARSELPPESMPCDSRAGYRSVGQFLIQDCEFQEDVETSTQALYDAYTFENQGYQLSFTDFSRLLRENLSKYPNVKFIKRVGGKDTRGYLGIRLKQGSQETTGPLA